MNRDLNKDIIIIIIIIIILVVELILNRYVYIVSRIVTEKPHQGSVNEVLYCIVLYCTSHMLHNSIVHAKAWTNCNLPGKLTI